MEEIRLKYGCNPDQGNAKAYSSKLPFKILNGNVSYINLLDALYAWQLVREVKQSLQHSCATSFKHISPTSCALGIPLTEEMKKSYHIDSNLELSPIACAYARARGADRLSSFGDFIALSDMCDESCANLIAKEVSDGIIAPAYCKEALKILKQKKKGGYVILEIDPCYEPKLQENRDVFGVTISQERSQTRIDTTILQDRVTINKDIPKEASLDLQLALLSAKYTQSNSICYAYQGQVIGVGAGQQSRIYCTRLAGDKSRLWHLRFHQKVLNLPFLDGISKIAKDNAIEAYLSHRELNWKDYFSIEPPIFSLKEQEEYLSLIKGVSLASDAFFPFADNVFCAYSNGVSYIAQSGGSLRDEEVIKACNALGIVMVFTHLRLFHH